MAEKNNELQPGHSWWQSLLLYPTLVLSLGGSIPTVINAVKAWYLDVNLSRVQIVEEQRDLWEKNAACLLATAVYAVEVSQETTLSVSLCPSGDALLRYTVRTPDGERHSSYIWVEYPQTRDYQAPKGSLLPPESKSEYDPLRSSLLFGAIRCTFVSNTVAVQVITTDGKTCLAEVISFAKNRTLSSQQVSCTIPCFLLQHLG